MGASSSILLRKQGIAARNALSPAERAEASAAIVRRIAASPEFRQAKTVMLYRAVKGEVNLAELTLLPEAAGKRLVYPLCTGEGRMIALLPRGPESWKKGFCGIPEPMEELSDPVRPEELDMILCPCSRFDGQGGRIGMGGGYYDRYLPKCVNAFAAAVAFEVQRAERVERESWDVPMAAVFTEAERMDCPGNLWPLS